MFSILYDPTTQVIRVYNAGPVLAEAPYWFALKVIPKLPYLLRNYGRQAPDFKLGIKAKLSWSRMLVTSS